MDQYLKGSLEAANSLALAERDIAATQNHHNQRSKREALDRSLAQKGGVITVGDARGKIKAWRIEKVAKHNEQRSGKRGSMQMHEISGINSAPKASN